MMRMKKFNEEKKSRMRKEKWLREEGGGIGL